MTGEQKAAHQTRMAVLAGLIGYSFITSVGIMVLFAFGHTAPEALILTLGSALGSLGALAANKK